MASTSLRTASISRVADGGENGTQPVLGRFSFGIVGFVGPIVELPLDEGVGTVAGDVSGQGNDGTLLNGAAFEPSTGDGSPFAVRFDGVDDYIDLGALDVNGTGLTLSAKFNADAFPGLVGRPTTDLESQRGRGKRSHLHARHDPSRLGDPAARARSAQRCHHDAHRKQRQLGDGRMVSCRSDV